MGPMNSQSSLFPLGSVTLVSGSSSSRAGELFAAMAENLSRGQAPLYHKSSEAEIAHEAAGDIGQRHRVAVVSITESEAALRAQFRDSAESIAVFNLQINRDSGGAPKLFESIVGHIESREFWPADDTRPLSVFFYGAVCAFTSTQNVNRYADVTRLMRTMQDFASGHNLRLFCLLPVGKNTAGYDPKERILGATAWGDMADLIIDVQIPTPDPSVPVDPSTTARQLWICRKNRAVVNYRAMVQTTGRFVISEVTFGRQGRKQEPSNIFKALNEILAERWEDLQSFRSAHIPGWLAERGMECSPSTAKRWVKWAVEEQMIECRGTYHDRFYVPKPSYFRTM